MRKKATALIALIATAFLVMVGTPAIAAEQTPQIASWNTVISTNDKGIVKATNTVSAISAGEKIEYALPVRTSWDYIKGFAGATKLTYAYRNFKVSPGYTIKVTTNANWSILTITPTADVEEKTDVTFSYDIHNAGFESKSTQQINVPLLPESFDYNIADYSVKINPESATPSNYCIRKEIDSSICSNAPAGDDESNVVYNNSYKKGDRIGLRASYPEKTFTLQGHKKDSFEGDVVNEDKAEAKLLNDWVKTINSWDSVAEFVITDKDKSSLSVKNTVSFEGDISDEKPLAFEYPLVVDNAIQRYTDFTVSTPGYEIETISDEITMGADAVTSVRITPKTPSTTETEDAASTVDASTVTPSVKKIEFSYKLNDVMRKGAPDKTDNTYAHVRGLIKPKAPAITAKNITVTLNTTVPIRSSESICSQPKGDAFTCDNSGDGVKYSAKGDINSEYYVIWGFSKEAVGPASMAPTYDNNTDTKETPSEPADYSGFFGFLGNAIIFILILGALYLGVMGVIRAFAARKFNNRSTKTSYGVASGKPSYFIPSLNDFKSPKNKKNTASPESSSLRSLGAEIFNLKPKFDLNYEKGGAGNVVQDVTFRPPRLDDGSEIKPYLYPFLSQNNEESAMLTSALSIIGGLASKDAIRLVHDNNGRAGIQIQPDGMDKSLSPIEVVALQQLEDSTVSGKLPVLTPRMLERITSDTRLGNMIKDEVTQLGFFNEQKGFLNSRNRGNALLGTGAGIAGLAGAIGGGIALFAGAPLIALAGAGVAGASFLGMKKPLENAGQTHHIRSVTGTGYLARMEAFRNYFKTANPDSRYSVERSDVDAEYLPWALAFDMPEKWVDTFSAPTSTSGKNVLISGNSYSSDMLSNSLRKVIKDIQVKTGQNQLLDKDRF